MGETVGIHFITKSRDRIIEKIDERLNKIEGLDKKMDYLRDVVYELVEAVTDEVELSRLEEHFSKS
jgi:uncharacterized lipoprotein YehR (DUF1307 family)